jgi:transglutaminase-like putative cysteine protease
MFAIQHVTVYRYAKPVKLGMHRLMFRPRDSHDLRLLNSMLTISPPAASVRWMHDVFGNSIAIAEFDCETAELRLQSDIVLEHFPLDSPAFEIATYARYYPFSYAMEEIPDLARSIERHYPDPEGRVDRWARQFAVSEGGGALVETQPMLERMMRAIKSDFAYRVRPEEGVQTPLQTLQEGSGSCRDFALLMIEAVRSLGFAARFVSGYVYDPAADGEAEKPGAALIGDGATHAWVQVYLPGAGWVEFDPSNAIVGGRNLIRVAVARDLRQAAPVSGTWTGSPGDYLGMEVMVRVSTHTDVTGMPAVPEPAPAPTFADISLQPGADKQAVG